MSQQSLRQASIRAVTSTTYTYEGDWHALWDLLGIAAGQFNERMLAYINNQLSASYTELNGAMAAFAAEHGSTTFQAIGTFTPGFSLDAPVLTSAVDTTVSDTTGSGSVTTDQGDGTLYFVVTTSATPPSATQVKAGNDHTGSAAADSGSQAVSGTGVQSITGGFTGLTASTAYYAHYMHENAGALQSDVSSGDGFTTNFAALVTTGLIGRYEAAVANFTLSSGLVDQWNDTSPVGTNHLTQTLTKRPTHRTDLFGGRVTFDGGDELIIPAGISLSRRSHSVYIVTRGPRGSSFGTWFALDTTPDLAMYRDNTTSDLMLIRDTGAINTGIPIGRARVGLNTFFMIGDAANFYAGHPLKMYTKGSALAAGTEAGGHVGVWDNAGNFFLQNLNDIVAILVFNVAHDATARNLVLDYLTNTYKSLSRSAPDTAILAVGDSLTFGTESTLEWDYSWPAQLCRQHTFHPFIDNQGVGGQAISTRKTAATEIAWVAYAAGFTNRVVVEWFGTNDVLATSATLNADIDTYISNIRGADAGAIIVGCTIIDGVYNGSQEAIRLAANTHILTTADFDLTVDLASMPELDDSSDTTYFDVDAIHLNDAGYAAVAGYIRSALVGAGYI